MSAATEKPAAASGRRILVIDDDEAILVPAAHYFRERGYTVVTAKETEEAQALLSMQSFDLVILDLALTPFGREGLDVLRWIRGTRPLLPVIILSAEVPPEVGQEATRLGANAVLCKPQPLSGLSGLVATLLEPR